MVQMAGTDPVVDVGGSIFEEKGGKKEKKRDEEEKKEREEKIMSVSWLAPPRMAHSTGNVVKC